MNRKNFVKKLGSALVAAPIAGTVLARASEDSLDSTIEKLRAAREVMDANRVQTPSEFTQRFMQIVEEEYNKL
jgi:hypothetical protein